MNISLRSIIHLKTAVNYANKNLINCIVKRASNDWVTKPIIPAHEYPEFDISRDEKEWEYVTRLLPVDHIPDPPQNVTKFPSGWKPQHNIRKDLPYFVQRSRNHMLPVYLRIRQRGMHRCTMIRNISGDIWRMERELKPFLERKAGKELCTKLHEMSGTIYVLGDHVSNTEIWLLNKGL